MRLGFEALRSECVVLYRDITKREITVGQDIACLSWFDNDLAVGVDARAGYKPGINPD
jgi:hypothetical protein